MINISFFKKIHDNIESDEEELIDMRDKGSARVWEESRAAAGNARELKHMQE
jgi:hypothetical protein